MHEFKETQRFNQWWLWIIGLFPVVITVSVFVTEFANGKTPEPESILGMGLTLVIMLLTFLWIRMVKLETMINGSGISVCFKGLFFAKRIIDWTEVESAEIVRYDPLWEYGGWGVKYSFKRGWCYNVSGDVGLRLKLRNGKFFLIGTQKPEEIRNYLAAIREK